jgi:hypothetical protein
VELSWLMKSRIAAAAVVGVIVIGVLAWPLVKPAEPFGPVRAGSIPFGVAVSLVLLAFLVGLIGYFVSWPHGREIGILAVPFGLAVWALRSGSIGALIQLNPALDRRQALFAALRWEPVFWLALVAAGFAGVFLGQRIRSRPDLAPAKPQPAKKATTYLNAAIAVAGSVLIAQFCIGIFTQDVRIPDSRLGSTVGQPAVGQIAFGVILSFAIAAFIVKGFLNAAYIWPIIASGIITPFVITTHVKQIVLQHLAENVPPVFFSDASLAVLPLQMVAFGTLGSVAGYWLALKYRYWRKQEAK